MLGEQLHSSEEWRHPELQEGEVVLINVRDEEEWSKPEFCEYVRRGEIAYTSGRRKEIVPNMRPLIGKLK